MGVRVAVSVRIKGSETSIGVYVKVGNRNTLLCWYGDMDIAGYSVR